MAAREGKFTPRTAREWQLYRHGILEGLELAQADARATAELFANRLKCGGVAFAHPRAPAEEARSKRRRSA